MYRIILTLLAGIGLCGCSSEPQITTVPQEFVGPRDAIVDGRLTVDVIELVASPRSKELGERLLQAARADPDWLREHVEKAIPGVPLPYDTRLGLSQAEYEEFLAQKMTARKGDESVLLITEKDNDVYVLDGGHELADFTGIEIDLKNEVVRTPFGSLTERIEINADDESAIGAWVGTQWGMEKIDPNGTTGTSAKLAVGKLTQSGRCVIYYDVRKLSEAGQTRISHVLNYDLPPKE